jgi:hypothetical protein
MKSLLSALLLVAVCTPGALAAPGDPRTLRGTLEWPASLTTEPFIVVRGEDGGHYYADVSAAARRGSGGLTAGTRMSLLGVEGARAFEIAAIAIGAGDAAIAPGTGPAPGDAVSASPPSAPRPRPTQPAASIAAAPSPGDTSADFWKVEGKIVSVSPREMVLETPRGQRTAVNIENLSPWTRNLVGPGDEVKLFGEDRGERRLVANGFIYLMPSPAASPRTTR